jgi:hypothetical protein
LAGSDLSGIPFFGTDLLSDPHVRPREPPPKGPEREHTLHIPAKEWTW